MISRMITILISYVSLGLFQGFFAQIFYFLGSVIGRIRYPLHVIDTNLFPVSASVYALYGMLIFFILFKLIRKLYIK